MEAGKVYQIAHSRKGKFAVKVEYVGKEWITGKIVFGKAEALLEHNELFVGDEISIRRSLFTYKEAPEWTKKLKN